MTAARRTILLCDKHGCRARYLGALWEAASITRRAAAEKGWTHVALMSYTGRGLDHFDHCPKHKYGA